MIRGYYGGYRGRLRPYVVADLAIPALRIVGSVHFLIDTGADMTVLSPKDAASLRLDLTQLPQATPTVGIGGRTPTASTEAIITLDTFSFTIPLRILAPASERQRQVLGDIPSLLGRDLLSHFALFLEERTGRVLLLEPAEADALSLP